MAHPLAFIAWRCLPCTEKALAVALSGKSDPGKAYLQVARGVLLSMAHQGMVSKDADSPVYFRTEKAVPEPTRARSRL